LEKREVARILEEIALLLELKGENPFKSRAYSNAARTLEGTTTDLPDLIRSGKLGELPGIGEALREKITTLVTAGRLPYYEELLSEFPRGILEILRIPGLGPKKVRVIWQQLGVSTLGELEYACHENRLAGIPGFGSKSQEKILHGLSLLKKNRERFLCDVALEEAESLLKRLGKHPAVQRMGVAGSIRRRCETSKDVDLVASSRDPSTLMQAFVSQPGVAEIVARGETKSSVRLSSGMGADLRVVSDKEFPFALHHFTGSKEHNVALRARAQRMGLKLNEYGLFRGEKLLPCKDEAAIYARLGLAFIPPELREDRGEIEAAEQGEFPRLVEWEDLRGVLHVHTQASDGLATLEEMSQAAKTLGLSYVGICDHSKAAQYAGGLDENRVDEQHREIEKLNRRLHGVTLLKGIEVDILADGSLDFTDEILSRFDLVVASVHSRFNLSEEAMTGRIIRAIQNPHVHILGHPTGRLLLAREPYAVDMAAVIRAAAAQGVCIELNANPHRLDLDWRWIPSAKKAGVKISIDPDAHQVAGIGDMRYGVGIARKGWLTRQDLLNTLPLPELLEYLRARPLHAAS
jgi:DNA polymerase (family X)